MKKLFSVFAVAIWMFAVLFLVTPLTAEAANVSNGTLGDHGGIQWTYDVNTKTLTITGEDTGNFGRDNKSVFDGICTTYGISRGLLTAEMEVIPEGVYDFIDRTYLYALGRAVYSVHVQNVYGQSCRA